MKTIRKITALICTAAVMTASSAFAVDVTVNNTRISFDAEPRIINDRTMVPMRAIFEVLGASIDWNGDTQTVTAERGGDKISLTIGSSVMTVNGKSKTLDAAPVIADDRTLVPVRAISEALGSSVEWDSSTQTAKITDNSGMADLSVATKYAPAWKTAYSSFLNGKKGKFELIYLNNDDIPEIVVASGSAHSNGVALYTYSDGSVKTISDKTGTYGTISYKERGSLIAYDNGGNGSALLNYIVAWNGSELVQEHEFTWSFRSNTFTWNGGSISESTYNSEWTRMTAGYKTAGYMSGTAISSANIKAALGL